MRTNAENISDFALAADMSYLEKVWESIMEVTQAARPGECIYEDLSLPLRALRDHMHEDSGGSVSIRSRSFDRLRDFTGKFLPEWMPAYRVLLSGTADFRSVRYRG